MPEPNDRWGLGRRIGFRFLAAYLTLYYLPLPRGIDHDIARWLGLGPYQGGMTGSGDTALDYLHIGALFAFTTVIVIGWSILDQERDQYQTLHLWLRMLLRYALAGTLLTYGFDKVFPTQFRPPTLTRLVEPFGNFSPMGVLWTFMGASMPYTIFSGIAECVAGTLLLFRRTATLGALSSVAVLLNIVALNFCYDVPVKLFSSHLLFTAIVVAAPDLSRLFDFFVRQQAIGPAAEAGPPLTNRWFRAVVLISQALFVVMIGVRAFETYSLYRSLDPPPFAGIYDVESDDGLRADDDTWRRIAFESAAFAMLMTSDGTPYSVPMKYEKESLSLRIGTRKFQMSPINSDPLILVEGEGESRKELRLKKSQKSGFLVLDRGFHWISEVPYNR